METELTPEKALDLFMEADSKGVEAFNREWRYAHPPVEIQIEFLRQRFTNAMGCMVGIMRILAKRQPPSAGASHEAD